MTPESFVGKTYPLVEDSAQTWDDLGDAGQPFCFLYNGYLVYGMPTSNNRIQIDLCGANEQNKYPLYVYHVANNQVVLDSLSYVTAPNNWADDFVANVSESEYLAVPAHIDSSLSEPAVFFDI